MKMVLLEWLFNKIRKNPIAKGEQFSPERDDSVVSDAIVKGDVNSDGDAEQQKDLESIEQLPAYESLITGVNGEYALGDEGQRASLAVLRVNSTIATVLVTRRELNSNEYLSLLQTVRRRYPNATTLVARASLLVALYETEKHTRRRSERQEGEESLSASIFRDMIERGIAVKSSDLHVCIREESGSAALLYRINGRLFKQDGLPDKKAQQAMLYAYTKLADPDSRSDPTYSASSFQSCSIQFTADNGRAYRLRYQSFPCLGGQDVVFRILDNGSTKDVLSLDVLGYAESQCRDLSLIARKTSGLLMIAGRTNSGKSTTLHTLDTLSPTRRYRKRYEVSDPVEYRRTMTTQISVQRSANTSKKDENKDPFEAPRNALLRGDLDELTIGEIRDSKNGSMVKTMVQSGHKVCSTTHCDSAIEIIERLASPEVGIPRDILGSRKFIAALIYQHLVPVLCSCKLPAKGRLPVETEKILGEKFGLDVDTMFVTNQDGCEHCNFTGTKKLTVIAEIIIPDRNLLQFIRQGKDVEAEEYWRKTRKHDFTHPDMTGKTCLEHGLYKVHLGLVDPVALEDEFEPFELYHPIPIQTAAIQN